MSQRFIRHYLIVGALALSIGVAIFSGQPTASQTNDYIGDEKCLSCHENQRKYLGTAHHLTSQAASAKSIAGSFAAGKNILKVHNELQFRMESKPDGFFQTGVLGTPPDTLSISKRIDFVIGSGRKGQTYIYWDNEDQLFQLPVSYWTEVN